MASEEDRLVNEIYHRLNIEEDEGILEYTADIAHGDQGITGLEWQHCVVGRLVTEKMINFPVFKQIMASVWRPGKGVLIKELGNNVFIFQFFHLLDVDRVLRDGPWNYQQIPILLHRLQPHENPRQTELVHLDLWVQIHNIPNGFMSERIAVDAGNYIGKYVESDSRNFLNIWKEFMRIRVTIDIRKPLKRKLFVKRPQGDKVCLEFKYKRLNTFCYFCGILGHTNRFCSLLYDYPQIPRKRFAYGPWLKADSRRTTQMGDRWLWSEYDIPADFNDKATDAPAILVANPMIPTDKGKRNSTAENQGIQIFPKQQISGGSWILYDQNQSKAVTEGIRENVAILPYLPTDTIMIMDSKRRRLQEATTSGHADMEEEFIPSTLDADSGPKNLTLVGFVSEAHQQL